MILQALNRLYEDLAERGEISRPGWGPAKISYALCIDESGELLQVIPMMEEAPKQSKKKILPRIMNLPAAVNRAYGVAPNFLWDNSTYMLGINDKEPTGRELECFRACAELHHNLLDALDCVEAQAISRFFDTWKPAQAREHPVMEGCIDEITRGANLLFRVNGVFPQERSEICEAWQRHYDQCAGTLMRCLVTGELDEIVPVHPDIRGVKGSHSKGGKIVSFNKQAFCSYGKEQNYNAPVGKRAAFAYTTALNHLLADWDNVREIGDTTVICWAEGAEPQYTSFSCAALFGAPPPDGMSEDDLRAIVGRLANGLPCDEVCLDPRKTFYIMGIAPNIARLSIRFFFRDTFGVLMRNVNAHNERLQICGNKFSTIPLWALLRETVNLKTSDKAPSPVMAGSTARAIFSGTPYPVSLLEATMLRVRAERDITPGRAAILKAYYLRNPNPNCPQEVLTVSLNESSTNIPYTLGRLFSVYEAVQERANPGINATIKDKYFNSAASTPATIFPILDNLCQKHLRKIDGGLRGYFEKEIRVLKNILGEENPLRLTLPEQGSFNLGYYHQTQKRYTKKEDNNNGSNQESV